jgi:LacI family transcriptional regulator
MSKPASLAAVAERAGVSIATVSRVMNGVTNKASAATRARVQQAVADLGYRPAGAGQALRQGRSRLVAVLGPNLANPSMAAIAASIEAALRPLGLVMVLCDTSDDAPVQDAYLREMRALQVRAIVLLGAVASPLLATMQQDNEPLLFVNRGSPHPGACSFIGIDNHAAGRDVASFFLDNGIGLAGVIHGSRSSSATAERLAGFRARLDEAGGAVPRFITDTKMPHLDLGHRAAARLLGGRKPSQQGLFCASDLIAYGAHRWLRENGFGCPDPVTLIGFDDNPMNDWIAPWLSSVRVPFQDFGPAIVESLQAIWDGEAARRVLLAHRIVRRP